MSKSSQHTPDQLIAAQWRSAILKWSFEWPDSGLVMPSGKRRSAFRLLQAALALADEARADGSLRGWDKSRERYWWLTLDQLAKRLHMSKSVAKDTLGWLEREGWLAVKKGEPTAEGAGVDERSLVVSSLANSDHEPTHGSPPNSDHEPTVSSPPNSTSEPTVTPAGQFTFPGGSVHFSQEVSSPSNSTGEPHLGIPGVLGGLDGARNKSGRDVTPTPERTDPGIQAMSLEQINDLMSGKNDNIVQLPAIVPSSRVPGVSDSPQVDDPVRHRLAKHDTGIVLRVWEEDRGNRRVMRALVRWDAEGDESPVDLVNLERLVEEVATA